MMTQLVRSWDLTCNGKQCLLIKLQAPIVGTGMEREIARASGAMIISEACWSC